MELLNEISIYDKTYNRGYKGYIILNDDFWYEGFIFENMNDYKTYELTFGFYLPNGIKQMIIIPMYDEVIVPKVIRNNERTKFENCDYMISAHGEIRTDLELIISSTNIELDFNGFNLKKEVLGIVEKLKEINSCKQLYENTLAVRKLNPDILINQYVNCGSFDSSELNEILERSSKAKQKMRRDFFDAVRDGLL